MTSLHDNPQFTVSRSRTVEVVDLAAKWHHGWVPANAEAMRIKAGKIKSDGGFSINKNGDSPKSGYMVSFDAKHGGVETTISGEVTAKHIADHQTAVGKMLDDPSNFHGAWKDPDSGKTFLDVSKNHKDLASAARMAHEQKQLAIYDVENGKSIKTSDALHMAVQQRRDQVKDLKDRKMPMAEWRKQEGLRKAIEIFQGFKADGTREAAHRERIRGEVGVTLASHIRSVNKTFGSDRSKWPPELLKAAAPYDMVARMHYDKVKVIPSKGKIAPPNPKGVLRHRPHTEKATDSPSRDLGANPMSQILEVANKDGSVSSRWTGPGKKKKGKSVKKAEKVSLSNVDLAITPGGRQGDASPLGKGKRKLSDYEREVAHALMRKGKSKRDAIKMARGIINHAAATGRWSKGKAKPNVVAGAQASIAQRKSFSNTDTADIDLGIMGHGILTGTPFTKKGADRQAKLDKAGTGAKWRHGWIPANHAAELIAGARVRPRALKGIEKGSKRRGTVVGTSRGLGTTNVKVKWSDTGKVTNHDAMMLDVKGGIEKQLSLSNDVDLAPKWKHGFIPLNAEALAIKEHKAKGHGASSGSSNPLVGHTKYHSAATRGKLTQKDLRAHAKAHAAAAHRARSNESAMKHVKEAQASMDEVLKRQGAARDKKASIGSKGHKAWKVEHEDTRGEDLAKEDDLSGKRKKAKAAAKAARETTHKDDLGDTHTHEAPAEAAPARTSAVSKMDPKTLSAELKKAEKSGNTKRVNALKKEKAKRLATVKAAKSQHDEAQKWVDKHWKDMDTQDPKSVSRFLNSVVKIFPAAKSKLWSLKDKDGKISGIKNAEAFKIVLSEVFREFARQISGPLLASGIGSVAGALGLGILKAHGG